MKRNETASGSDPLTVAITQAQHGDHAAFDQLVLRCHQELRCFVSIRIHSLSDADEIVQDTFVTAYEKIAGYEHQGNFMGWLKGIARNKLKERYRQRRPLAVEDAFLQSLVVHPGEALDDAGEQTDKLNRHLQNCLQRLPAKSRKLLDAAYVDGQSHKKIAQRYKRTVNAVTVALSKLRQKLRHCIEAQA